LPDDGTSALLCQATNPTGQLCPWFLACRDGSHCATSLDRTTGTPGQRKGAAKKRQRTIPEIELLCENDRENKQRKLDQQGHFKKPALDGARYAS